jgi:hypothetical protein
MATLVIMDAFYQDEVREASSSFLCSVIRVYLFFSVAESGVQMHKFPNALFFFLFYISVVVMKTASCRHKYAGDSLGSIPVYLPSPCFL